MDDACSGKTPPRGSRRRISIHLVSAIGGNASRLVPGDRRDQIDDIDLQTFHPRRGYANHARLSDALLLRRGHRFRQRCAATASSSLQEPLDPEHIAVQHITWIASRLPAGRSYIYQPEYYGSALPRLFKPLIQ